MIPFATLVRTGRQLARGFALARTGLAARGESPLRAFTALEGPARGPWRTADLHVNEIKHVSGMRFSPITGCSPSRRNAGTATPLPDYEALAAQGITPIRTVESGFLLVQGPDGLHGCGSAV